MTCDIALRGMHKAIRLGHRPQTFVCQACANCKNCNPGLPGAKKNNKTKSNLEVEKKGGRGGDSSEPNYTISTYSRLHSRSKARFLCR